MAPREVAKQTRNMNTSRRRDLVDTLNFYTMTRENEGSVREDRLRDVSPHLEEYFYLTHPFPLANQHISRCISGR